MAIINETPTPVQIYTQRPTTSVNNMRFVYANVRSVAWNDSQGNPRQSTPRFVADGFARPSELMDNVATLDMSQNPIDDYVYALLWRRVLTSGSGAELAVIRGRFDFNEGIITTASNGSINRSWQDVAIFALSTEYDRISAHGDYVYLSTARVPQVNHRQRTFAAHQIRISNGETGPDIARTVTYNPFPNAASDFVYKFEVDGPYTTLFFADFAATYKALTPTSDEFVRKIEPRQDEAWEVVPWAFDARPLVTANARAYFTPIVPVDSLQNGDSTPPTIVWNTGRRRLAVDHPGGVYSPTLDGLLEAGRDSVYCVAEAGSRIGIEESVSDLVVQRTGIETTPALVVFNDNDEVQEFTRPSRTLTIRGPSTQIPESVWNAERIFIYDPAGGIQYEVRSVSLNGKYYEMELSWR